MSEKTEQKQPVSKLGLETLGFSNLGHVYWNLPVARLYEEAISRHEAVLSKDGALLVHTGSHTGRAAEDKYFVREPTTEKDIDWGAQNRPFPVSGFQRLHARLAAYLQGRDVFVQDCVAGAGDVTLNIRVVTERAYLSLFARNMIAPAPQDTDFFPEFTIVVAPGFEADPCIDGTRSKTAIVLNFSARTALICGTAYSGELKKTVFTVLNYLLPLKDILPMHCSANVGENGEVAIFFGLSGTGKTTLSADPKRRLIGDDEHGWSSDSTFNFENGCYAKVIRLSAEAEPDIYATTKRFGTILENVVFDPETRAIDLDDASITENTRASYPIDFIQNFVPERLVKSTPRHVVLLTCDALGVLPPIARLTPEQSVYHFISGYTSKVAGTEVGLCSSPQATFSACFGAPFMVYPPYRYARMLQKRLEKGATCWLLNTGWQGGGIGCGHRISIRYTRALLDAALSGALDKVTYHRDPIFGFEVPTLCPGVPSEILDPKHAWKDAAAFERAEKELAALYIANFTRFADKCPADVVNHGPKFN